MCGIILIYSKKNKLNKKDCKFAFDAIKNRGPDKYLKQFFLKKKLFIGNSILSIVGKKKSGSELYQSSNKQFKIAYNGEIYNYEKLKKKTNTKKKLTNDTEVLINLFQHYKHNKIPKFLDGMFAYCVFDSKTKNIYFATDVQGERKLFLYNDDNYFICSSNINAIVKFLKNLHIDTNKFAEYFDTRHFVLYNKTVYKNIEYLLPGKSYSYNLIKNTVTSNTYDDPVNWISEKKYKKFNNLNIKDITDYFENIIIQSKNKMLPNKNFFSLFSGGIDSSLQSKLLDNSNNLKGLLFVDHEKKDPISNKINLFNKYLSSKIYKINLNKKKYSLDLKKVYQSLNLPFLTHDLVGINKCFEFVKRKKCKIVFNAGGVDELFGGYKLYKETNWNQDRINLSPYSSYSGKYSKKINTDYKIQSDKLWLKAFKKYKLFMNIREAKIQASLFTDYFVQAVGVHNISWHILAGENSVEVRNLFINKSVIKEVINLPIKYKINKKYKNNFALKHILKRVFVKNFEKKLVFKKQGFSGFPNESFDYLSNSRKIEFKKLIKKVKLFLPLDRDNFWKLLNIFYFKKFCNPNLEMKEIFDKFN